MRASDSINTKAHLLHFLSSPPSPPLPKFRIFSELSQFLGFFFEIRKKKSLISLLVVSPFEIPEIPRKSAFFSRDSLALFCVLQSSSSDSGTFSLNHIALCFTFLLVFGSVLGLLLRFLDLSVFVLLIRQFSPFCYILCSFVPLTIGIGKTH